MNLVTGRKLLLYEEVSDVRTLDFILRVSYARLSILYSAFLATMKRFHTCYSVTINCIFFVNFEEVVAHMFMMWVMNLRRVFRTLLTITYVMLCTIWYHFYNLKNVKNARGRVLLLVAAKNVFSSMYGIDVIYFDACYLEPWR